LAILIGSFSLALLAPEMQGMSSSNMLREFISNTLLQRLPMDVVQLPNFTTPSTAFPTLTQPTLMD
jgi:hypothetical protein